MAVRSARYKKRAGVLPEPGPAWQDAGLFVLRAFAGLMLMRHGLQKLPPPPLFVQGVANMGFPQPELFAWAAASAEFFGGLLLALGLFARLGALLALSTLLVAAFRFHAHDSLDRKELPFLYVAVLLALALTGPGRWAMGRVFRRD